MDRKIKKKVKVLILFNFIIHNQDSKIIRNKIQMQEEELDKQPQRIWIIFTEINSMLIIYLSKNKLFKN